MKWVVLHYGSLPGRDDFIKHSLCHPDYSETRRTYIKERYGVEPAKVEEFRVMFLDLGGMICTKDPKIEIPLDEDRVFSCWRHQADTILSFLKQCKIEGNGFRRVPSWPASIDYISESDFQAICKGIEKQTVLGESVEHKIKMREALIKANTHGDPEKEPEVRAMFDKLDGKEEEKN